MHVFMLEGEGGERFVCVCVVEVLSGKLGANQKSRNIDLIIILCRAH